MANFDCLGVQHVTLAQHELRQLVIFGCNNINAVYKDLGCKTDYFPDIFAHSNSFCCTNDFLVSFKL